MAQKYPNARIGENLIFIFVMSTLSHCAKRWADPSYALVLGARLEVPFLKTRRMPMSAGIGPISDF